MKEVIGFKGKIIYDYSEPDGMPRKLLDVSKLSDLNWKPKIPLSDGIRKIYEESQSGLFRH